MAPPALNQKYKQKTTSKFKLALCSFGMFGHNFIIDTNVPVEMFCVNSTWSENKTNKKELFILILWCQGLYTIATVLLRFWPTGGVTGAVVMPADVLALWPNSLWLPGREGERGRAFCRVRYLAAQVRMLQDYFSILFFPLLCFHHHNYRGCDGKGRYRCPGVEDLSTPDGLSFMSHPTSVTPLLSLASFVISLHNTSVITTVVL